MLNVRHVEPVAVPPQLTTQQAPGPTLSLVGHHAHVSTSSATCLLFCAQTDTTGTVLNLTADVCGVLSPVFADADRTLDAPPALRL